MKLSLRGVCDETGGVPNLLDGCAQENIHPSISALGFEHAEDTGRGAIAEELSKGLFVIWNIVFFHQRDEIRGRVTGQRGLGKMGIGREKMLGLAVNVSEIAASATGDEDFLAQPSCVLDDGDAAATFASFDRAHEARCAAAENQNVE